MIYFQFGYLIEKLKIRTSEKEPKVQIIKIIVEFDIFFSFNDWRCCNAIFLFEISWLGWNKRIAFSLVEFAFSIIRINFFWSFISRKEEKNSLFSVLMFHWGTIHFNQPFKAFRFSWSIDKIIPSFCHKVSLLKLPKIWKEKSFTEILFSL